MKKLKLIDKKKIKLYIRLIQFGMNSALMIFQEKYYKYGGGIDMQEKGLTIGGCESAWLVNLSAAYILKIAQNNFKDNLHVEIYRDNGICITKKIRVNVR